MLPLIIVLCVIGFLLLVFVIMLISFFNGTKKLQLNIGNSKAQLDVQLKRRFDLIPNLVETVKGYTKHESETLKNITGLRSKIAAPGGNTPENQALLSSEIAKFNISVEAYPELKANTNFMSLQGELNNTETKIAHFRQFVNDSVLQYNRRIATFPNLIFAKMFGFKAEEALKTPELERENVKVSF